jgi:hypothetical protein
MAKFSIKITLEDGTSIDDVSAIFPDQIMPAMIGAAEKMGHYDIKGEPILGGRAVTYAVRWFITNLVKDYANEAAAQQAVVVAKEQVDSLLSGITIEENV